MVLPKYQVSLLTSGKWAVVVAKGRNKGEVVETFDNCEDAWASYRKKYAGSK